MGRGLRNSFSGPAIEEVGRPLDHIRDFLPSTRADVCDEGGCQIPEGECEEDNTEDRHVPLLPHTVREVEVEKADAQPEEEEVGDE